MEKENERTSWLFIGILCLVFFTIGLDIGKRTINNKHETDINISDTTYNHIVLDSIEYNITYQDSIIYNIKEELKDEIKEALSDNDSIAINKFTELASAN